MLLWNVIEFPCVRFTWFVSNVHYYFRKFCCFFQLFDEFVEFMQVILFLQIFFESVESSIRQGVKPEEIAFQQQFSRAELKKVCFVMLIEFL